MTRTDYVIVGAGSAGCVLARRLSEERGCSVMLVEAGPARSAREVGIPAAWVKLLRGPHDWAFRTEPQPSLGGRRVFVPRGKALGGSSAINVQMYIRGHRADYDEWARLGNAGWSYEEVLPYFRCSEDNSRGASAWHGVGGPLAVSDFRDPNPLTRAFVRACVESGIPENPDLNGAELDGAAQVQVTQRGGRRCSAADAFLTSVKRRPNLTLVTDAHVTRIVLDGRRATGVEYARDGLREIAAATRAVVIAAGTIGSPQLLMLSGIGPAETLRDLEIAVVHDLPEVGRNLIDHPLVCTHVGCSRPVTLAAAESIPNLLRYFTRHRGLLTSNGAEAAAFVRTRPDLSAPDLELPFAAVLYEREWETPPTEHGFTIGAVALQPRSRGAVRLRSPDPFAPPAIDPALLSDSADLDVLVHGVHLARRIAAAPAFADWRRDEINPGPASRSDNDVRAFIRDTVHTIYHPVGTCRMGVVVDPELRVLGVEHLRVADASIMPTIPRGHTNAAAIMIGEKAAALIKGMRD